MTLLTAEGQQPRAKQAIEITKSALKRIRIAMAKEGVSPDAGRPARRHTGRRLLRPQLQHPLRHRNPASATGLRLRRRHRDPQRPQRRQAIRLFVDPKSYLYLAGMVLDFEETLMRQGFNFINPNSTKSCGCGSSFSA
jgi:iron-sulfur cluster assembly protein